jgi:hypothetical protein
LSSSYITREDLAKRTWLIAEMSFHNTQNMSKDSCKKLIMFWWL